MTRPPRPPAPGGRLLGDRVPAELELQRFRDLTDRAADFIAIAAADGTGIYVNPAGRDMIGMPRERPAADSTMSDGIAPADRRRFDGVLVQVRESGSWSGPMRFVDSAGTAIPTWLAIVAHRDERGEVAFFTSVAQDLRERRGGEPALQQERERYRVLVAQAPVGIWVCDRHGDTTFTNEHLVALTGRTAEDLAGEAWLGHVHPDDRAGVDTSWAAAVRDGAEWHHEFRLTAVDGTTPTVLSSARPLRDAAGAVTGFLGTTIDVTGHRAAERARRIAASEQAARTAADAAAARLHAMVSGIAAIVWEAEWDAERGALRFTFVSDRAEELLGHPAARWIADPAFWPSLIHPDDRADVLRRTEARTTRGADHQLTYRACARDGRTVWMHQVVHVVRDADGGSPRAQGVAVDVTQQKRAERATELLAEAGRLLADTSGTEQKLAALAQLVALDFGDAATVSLLGVDGMLRRAAVAHRDPAVEQDLLHLAPTPVTQELADVLEPGFPVVLPGASRDGSAAPEDVLRVLDAASALLVPLVVDERLAGALTFLDLGAGRLYDHLDLDLAAELGRRVSLLLESDRIRTRERHLQQLTTDLAAAGSVAEAAQRLVARLRDVLGAHGVSIYLPEQEHDTLRLVRGLGFAEELLDRYSVVRMDDSAPLGRAARTGEPVWIRDRDDWQAGWPDLLRHVVDGQRHAAVALPLRTAGRLVGAVTMSFPTTRTFPPDERAFVLALAAQAAPALERVAAADERRMIAETLQNALLPSVPPRLEHLALAARYLSGAHGTRAGGDWYDVLPLDGGHVAIAVGDVVGQGTRAAAVMGQLRSALSGYLLEGHDPATALGHLDRFAHRVPGAAGSTATCLVIDPATGDLTWARAGHPPPLVIGPGGPRFLDDATGTVLAVRGRPAYVPGRARLEPGESVVLYTDGLVERRGEVVDDGLRRLADAGRRAHPLPPAELAEALLTAGLGPGTPDTEGDRPDPPDDVALVVARRVPGPLLLDLPAEGTQLHVLRGAVAEWSAATGIGDDETYDLQLTVGEAATNVMEHAYPDGGGRLRVALVLHGDRVRVRVSDDGTWRAPAVDRGHRGRGLDLVRAIASDVELTPGPGGTRLRFSVPVAAARPGPATPPTLPVLPERGPTALRTLQVGAATHLLLVGDLDPATTDTVRPAVLAAAGAWELVVDLRASGYVSSAGMALLVEASESATAAGGTLRVLATPGGAVRRVLALGGVDTVVRVDEDGDS